MVPPLVSGGWPASDWVRTCTPRSSLHDWSALGPRIVVVDTTGSGKSTVASELATLLGVTYVELDALNWEEDWVGLNEHDPREFRRRVEEVVRGDACELV